MTEMYLNVMKKMFQYKKSQKKNLFIFLCVKYYFFLDFQVKYDFLREIHSIFTVYAFAYNL